MTVAVDSKLLWTELKVECVRLGCSYFKRISSRKCHEDALELPAVFSLRNKF